MPLSDVFRFSRPKGPGYGISREFYLSVLAATARLPAPLEVANPKGEGGAVRGYAAPLRSGLGRDILAQPMERGAYVIASPDRKTVLKLMVAPRDEAGFDPDVFIRSAMGASADPDLVGRIRATWTVLQLAFEGHDPDVYPSLDFLVAVARRLSELTSGVVADPLAERYLLPQAFGAGEVRPVDATNHVAAGWIGKEMGAYAYTLGMRKFGLPEFELDRVPMGSEVTATRFLLGLCQHVLLQGPLEVGAQVGERSAPLVLTQGGLDKGRWEGIDVIELLPVAGSDPEPALKAWSKRAP